MAILQDPLFFSAAEFVVKTNRCNCSLLQRKFKITWFRASALIEQLQKAFIIGAWNGETLVHPVLANEKLLEELKVAAEETA